MHHFRAKSHIDLVWKGYQNSGEFYSFFWYVSEFEDILIMSFRIPLQVFLNIFDCILKFSIFRHKLNLAQ